jgi:hypothetical protein
MMYALKRLSALLALTISMLLLGSGLAAAETQTRSSGWSYDHGCDRQDRCDKDDHDRCTGGYHSKKHLLKLKLEVLSKHSKHYKKCKDYDHGYDKDCKRYPKCKDHDHDYDKCRDHDHRYCKRDDHKCKDYDEDDKDDHRGHGLTRLVSPLLGL